MNVKGLNRKIFAVSLTLVKFGNIIKKKDTFIKGVTLMKAEENKMIMARNIQRYMDQRGITRQQLCDALDIKYTTLRDWLKGLTYPRIGKVEAMANYFGCEKSDLIEEKKEKPTDNDGLSDKRKALIDFAKSVPDDKAEMILRVMKSIVEGD